MKMAKTRRQIVAALTPLALIATAGSAWSQEPKYKANVPESITTPDKVHTDLLGASRIPLTVLVDARGRVVEKVYGAMQWDSPQALQLIARAFRRPADAPRR